MSISRRRSLPIAAPTPLAVPPMQGDRPAAPGGVLPHRPVLPRPRLPIIRRDAGIQPGPEHFRPATSPAKNVVRLCFLRGPFCGHFTRAVPSGRSQTTSSVPGQWTKVCFICRSPERESYSSKRLQCLRYRAPGENARRKSPPPRPTHPLERTPILLQVLDGLALTNGALSTAISRAPTSSWSREKQGAGPS
jgi:hypothetical protein